MRPARAARFAAVLSPRVLLHAEGAALLAVALGAYAALHAAGPASGAPGAALHAGRATWGVFAAAFLLPDLAMAGYLAGPAAGARAYNLAHTVTLPAALLAAGAATGRGGLVAAACIWLAHIGFDRLLGYGLKYPSAFRDTHLQRVA